MRDGLPDTGVTGLVVLCYLGAGYTHEEGKYADQVDRALRWLVRHRGRTVSSAERRCDTTRCIATGWRRWR